MQHMAFWWIGGGGGREEGMRRVAPHSRSGKESPKHV